MNEFMGFHFSFTFASSLPQLRERFAESFYGFLLHRPALTNAYAKAEVADFYKRRPVPWHLAVTDGRFGVAPPYHF